MKPMTRKEYEENLRRLSAEAFKSHDTVTEVGPGHWRIRRKGESFYWAEIVVMTGAIAVWGDIDACTFAYCPYKEPRRALSWISGSHLGYLREKAAIGMSNIGDTTTDDAVAIEDIRYLIEQYQEDADCDGVEMWEQRDYFRYGGDEEIHKEERERIDTLKEAIRELRRGDPVELVRNSLYDCCLFEAEDIYHIGDVVDPRVAYAAAAISRLNEMLKERDEEEAA
jgi:hypothetical protein